MLKILGWLLYVLGGFYLASYVVAFVYWIVGVDYTLDWSVSLTVIASLFVCLGCWLKGDFTKRKKEDENAE